MITSDQFRDDFPEFADEIAYPDDTVEFWLATAFGDLNAARFGDQLTLAAELFTGHMLVLARRNEQAALSGNVPGGASGVVTSKSVDKVSVSYDASMVSEAGAGFWNSTNYGLRFWWLLRQRCLGPVYRAPADSRFLR